MQLLSSALQFWGCLQSHVSISTHSYPQERFTKWKLGVQRGALKWHRNRNMWHSKRKLTEVVFLIQKSLKGNTWYIKQCSGWLLENRNPDSSHVLMLKDKKEGMRNALQEIFISYCDKKISLQIVEQWIVSHREIVKFLSLKIFKTHLDRALSDLIRLWSYSALSRGLG